MKVNAYLSFEGRCDEAIEFYKSALGAQVDAVMRYKDQPMPPGMIPENWQDKVMHSSFRIGDAVVMASDGTGPGQATFKGVSLTLIVDSDADADKYFAALSDGGTVQMPIEKTFFASRFGMVADRFGVPWMVITEA
jgi:PhnB protein